MNKLQFVRVEGYEVHHFNEYGVCCEVMPVLCAAIDISEGAEDDCLAYICANGYWRYLHEFRTDNYMALKMPSGEFYADGRTYKSLEAPFAFTRVGRVRAALTE